MGVSRIKAPSALATAILATITLVTTPLLLALWGSCEDPTKVTSATIVPLRPPGPGYRWVTLPPLGVRYQPFCRPDADCLGPVVLPLATRAPEEGWIFVSPLPIDDAVSAEEVRRTLAENRELRLQLREGDVLVSIEITAGEPNARRLRFSCRQEGGEGVAVGDLPLRDCLPRTPRG